MKCGNPIVSDLMPVLSAYALVQRELGGPSVPKATALGVNPHDPVGSPGAMKMGTVGGASSFLVPRVQGFSDTNSIVTLAIGYARGVTTDLGLRERKKRQTRRLI